MVIDICEKNLTEVPEDVWDNTDCTELYLCNNFLNSLSSHIHKLQKLEVLDLSGNLSIRDLPLELGDLPCLHYLNLGQTGLLHFPDCIFTPPNLKELIFLDNNLPSLPGNVRYAKKIERMQLDDVRLKTIPNEIVELKNLKILSLSFNPYLSENFDWILPISKLIHLEELYLLTVKIPDHHWTFLKQSLPNTKIFPSADNYFADKDKLEI